VSSRRSFLHRLTANAHKLDADELADEVAQLACVRLDDVRRGVQATVTGRLRSVVYNPHGDVQTLEAELYDGTASIELVWLGRRRIAGLEPGRRLVARGRVADHDGQPAMYNPWYALRSNG
jgi:RecG-like helicase